MIALLVALVGCTATPPDIDLTGPPHARPPRVLARCVPVTVEDVQIRGISSPSITDHNTRMIGRTADGRSVAWDYSRALWPGPPLEAGHALVLLVASDGAPAGVAQVCPHGMPVDGVTPRP